MRLNRGASCSVAVAYSYLIPTGLFGKAEVDPRTEATFTPYAEVVAQLVMQGSGVTPRLPAAKTDRFRSDQDRKRFEQCAAAPDSERHQPDGDSASVGSC